MKPTTTLLLIVVIHVKLVISNDYNRLFDNLLSRNAVEPSYNRLSRPAERPNETISIEFKFRLSMLVDVHERDQVITTNGWLKHHWFDVRLSWEPLDYGGVDQMHIPGEMVWLPDIILYNNAHGSPYVSAITKVLVEFDGRVTWEAPVIYNSFCNIDIEWYPYDIQKCELKFGSWTYSGTQLNLIHPKTDDVNHSQTNNESLWTVLKGIDISEYQESVEWDLLSVIGTRHEKWYPCCDYPSIDITYYLHIRRKRLFYTVHLVIPCISLAALTCWVFYLPCESHQKIQLCISILVALTVFFLLLTEIIPPTSIVTPLIVKYLTFTMLMVSLSVISTVIVQNIHFRTSNNPMSPWIKKIFVEHLGRQLLISRETEQANFHRKAQHDKQVNALSAMSILQKQFQKTLFDIEMSSKAKKTMPTVNSLFLELPMMARSRSVKSADNVKIPRQKTIRRQKSINLGEPAEKPTTVAVRNRLKQAEKNVHYVAETLTKRRTDLEASEDWQFISLVVDRILLICFTTIIILVTLATFLSAPTRE